MSDKFEIAPVAANVIKARLAECPSPYYEYRNEALDAALCGSLMYLQCGEDCTNSEPPPNLGGLPGLATPWAYVLTGRKIESVDQIVEQKPEPDEEYWQLEITDAWRDDMGISPNYSWVKRAYARCADFSSPKVALAKLKRHLGYGGSRFDKIEGGEPVSFEVRGAMVMAFLDRVVMPSGFLDDEEIVG